MVAEARADLRKPTCRYCDSANLYWHGVAKKRKVLQGGLLPVSPKMI